jgi:hypothetical protein
MRVENEEELASMTGTEEELAEHKARLEGQALTMYAGVRVGAQF